MIVYAESNFLLEWILLQPHANFVDQIVGMAEASSFSLRIPTNAFAEVRSTLERMGVESKALLDEIQRQSRDARKSVHGQKLANQYLDILDTIREKSNADLRRYDEIAGRCFRSASTLELSEAVLSRLPATRTQYDLKVQDALIFATILADLDSEPRSQAKLFLQPDKDFNKEEIVSVLNSLGCTCIWNFESAWNRLDAEIKSRP